MCVYVSVFVLVDGTIACIAFGSADIGVRSPVPREAAYGSIPLRTFASGVCVCVRASVSVSACVCAGDDAEQPYDVWEAQRRPHLSPPRQLQRRGQLFRGRHAETGVQ